MAAEVPWAEIVLCTRQEEDSMRSVVVVALATLILVASLATKTTGAALASESVLPERSGPQVKTTSGVPHVQLGVEVVPKVNDALMRRVAALPSVDIRPTVVSLPGARGFWLLEELQLERPEVIVGGREFAHMHPDGSLHASLPPRRALEAVAAGWAVRHPWAQQRPGWEGFVMLFTPLTLEEADVIFGLIVDGYNFVTGKDLRAEDFQDG